MSLLVDTSVWSLALRRDAPADVPEVRALRDALAGGEIVATTGVILQELLQGVVPERVADADRRDVRCAGVLYAFSRRSRRGSRRAQHAALCWCSGRHDRCAHRSPGHAR